jgi:hypothetical protein
MAIVTARIRPDSPRYRDWLHVFGCDVVALASPVPQWAAAPGVPRGEFYALHVPSLSAPARERLVARLADRFGIPPEEVSRAIDGPEGVPILADDVTVAIDARAFL